MNIIDITSKYKEKLRKNIFLKNIAIVAGGNVSAKFIGIISMPIITRFYSPKDFGIFSAFLSVAAIAGSLATFRYASTIPLAKDEKLADNLLKLCFFITFSFSLLIVAGIASFGDFIIDKFSVEQLKSYLWFLPVVFFATGIYEALNNWAIRNKDFSLITRTQISQSLSSSVIKIGFGVLKFVPLGLFLGHICQAAAGIGSLSLKLKKMRPSFFSNFSWSGVKLAAIRYKKFPLIQTWSQLLLVTGSHLPILLLSWFYGAKVAGVFALAMGMINFPMDFIGRAVAQVFYGEIAKYGKNNAEKIYKLSILIVKKLFWISLVPVVVLIFLGPLLFELIFGAEWVEAGLYARYFSIIVLTRFITSPTTKIFDVFEKQGIQLTLNIVRNIIVVLVFYVSHLLKWDHIEAIMLYGAIFPLYSVLGLFTQLKILKDRIKKVKQYKNLVNESK